MNSCTLRVLCASVAQCFGKEERGELHGSFQPLFCSADAATKMTNAAVFQFLGSYLRAVTYSSHPSSALEGRKGTKWTDQF